MPFVSVVMATFNGERHLREQLDSLAAQSHLPDELVVGDDGSSDETLHILETFASSAPFPVHVHRNEERLGFTHNFFATIQRSRGDILFLCDQDDVWSTEKIETMLAFMTQRPDAWYVVHDADYVDEALRPLGVTAFSIARNHLQPPTNLVHGCVTAIRRELVATMPPPPEAFYGQDVYLHVCAAALGRTATLDRVLLQYRRHAWTTTDSSEPKGRGNLMRWFRCAMLRDREACREHVKRVDEIIDALAARIPIVEQLQGRVDGSDARQVESYVRSLKRELASRRERRDARALPFARRVGSIIGLWRNGTYASGQGWLSVLRDLVLP